MPASVRPCYLVADFAHIREVEFLAEPFQLTTPGPTGRHLRPQIADHLFSIPHITADQTEEHFVRLTRIVEPLASE